MTSPALLTAGKQDRPDTGTPFDASNSRLFVDVDPGKVVAYHGGAQLRIETREQSAPGDDIDLRPERPEYVGKLGRHHPAADDDHAAREVVHLVERLVGVDAGYIDTGYIGYRRPRSGGSDDRIGLALLIVDVDPVTLQPAFSTVDDLDPGPAGLGVEDSGEFLLDPLHPALHLWVGDGRDPVQYPETLQGSGVVEEPGDIV